MTSPLLRHIEADTQTLDRARLAGAADGCVVVDARPGTRRQSWLGRDLLAAAGVDHDLGLGRNTVEDWQLLPVLLAARRINTIVIDHAQQLPLDVTTDALVLAAGVDANVWLITHGPTRKSFNDLLADWAAQPSTLSHLERALPMPTPAAAAPAGGALSVPDAIIDVDALLVRPLARELLPGAAADQFDAALASAISDARQVFDGADGCDPRPVTRWLHQRLDTCASRARWLLDVRALQIAGYWAGVLVGVDLPAIDGWLRANPGPGGAPASVWKRLRGYRQPFRGAVCALAAARLGSSNIRAVTIADTAPDGTTVTVSGHAVSIPAAAAEFVATQRLFRLADGVGGEQPLIATMDGKPVSDKFVARIISLARADLGVVVSSRWTERVTPADADVLRRLGITLTNISQPVPGGPVTVGRESLPSVPGCANAQPALLDTELIRRRRMELRRSRRDLAQALGVTGATIARLEEGANHGEQPLGLLANLADALALDLPTLLTGTGDWAPAAGAAAGSADTAALGSALHAAASPVPAAILARALGWTLDRFDAALDDLHRAAPAVGLRIDSAAGMVALVRAAEPLTETQLAAVLRHRVASRGVDTTAARLVHAALRHAVNPGHSTVGNGGLLRGNAERVAAAMLVNAGVLTVDDHGDVELTTETTDALFVNGL